MKCPHCATGIKLELEKSDAWKDENYVDTAGMGYCVAYGHCPVCNKLIVLLQHGEYTAIDYGTLVRVTQEEIIYPKYYARKVEPEVPDVYEKEYLEACAVLSTSAKASAALSRRLLQQVLREEFKIQRSGLAQEIDAFIRLPNVPSYLTQAVDAIRNVGNFAAHPLKDTNTGEVIDVEPGEAEWLLDVLESLFEFAFVQPKRSEERKQKLNQKLQAIGKPPMKG
jgi:hypothetical protein